MKDRTHIEGQRPFKDKRMLYFANRERTRHLGIFPPMGWLYYRDERATALGKERAKGVPSEAEAVELALRYLDKLTIDRCQFAKKDHGSELQAYWNLQDRSWFDKAKGEPVSEVISRGVAFVRQIDGVGFTGRGSDGGFSIRFASEGKVADLELVWRNLERQQLCKAISPAQTMDRIKQDRARMVPMTAVNLMGAKKLTINKMVPYYLGQSGDTPQEFVYPFAALECTLDFEGRSSTGVVLKCSILAD